MLWPTFRLAPANRGPAPRIAVQLQSHDVEGRETFPGGRHQQWHAGEQGGVHGLSAPWGPRPHEGHRGAGEQVFTLRHPVPCCCVPELWLLDRKPLKILTRMGTASSTCRSTSVRSWGHHALPVRGHYALPVWGHYALPVRGEHALPIWGHHALPIWGHQGSKFLVLSCGTYSFLQATCTTQRAARNRTGWPRSVSSSLSSGTRTTTGRWTKKRRWTGFFHLTTTTLKPKPNTSCSSLTPTRCTISSAVPASCLCAYLSPFNQLCLLPPAGWKT